MKSFDVPLVYRSSLISLIKAKRKEGDKKKKDFTPTLLNFGSLQIYLARHFGFCYGVENAIDIAFRTIEENPGKRIFLLSEMIHNPRVNEDLIKKGVQFLQDNNGDTLIPFENLTHQDIVLIPAFGTTLPIEKKLMDIGIRVENYNTTCPFVEKVWNRSEVIAKNQYTIIVHGKPDHEETRATFSHASAGAPTFVIKNMEEAIELAAYFLAEKPPAQFYERFSSQYSSGFDVSKDLQRIGVVNQTTMLASETQSIADYLKSVMIKKFQPAADKIKDYFADTRDTLCYATNDNQMAVGGLLQINGDLAIVIGGYNSSNTSHLVELCESRLPTYFIEGSEKILSSDAILHYNFHNRQELLTHNYLPAERHCKILITSGASCPDALVEEVIRKLASFFKDSREVEAIKGDFN
ncbi:MAG: 4-hydroxy-3-methylbut-2-enyl diphosphate reductase [Flavisolibacter sp.]